MKSFEPDPKYAGDPDELIEAFLDGMLDPVGRDRVLEAARTDASFAQRLAFARSIREALRTMPAEAPPPDLVPEVLATARKGARRDALANVRRWFSGLTMIDLRPVGATLTLIAVIIAAGVLGRPSQPAVDPEVAEALEQIKWTFALVSEVGDRTAVTLRDDVIEPHIVGNMQQAVLEVFDEPQ